MLIKCAIVAVGGAAGSVARFLLSTGIYAIMGRGFPYGILAVNVLGCLAMGFLAVLMIEKLALNALWTSGILVGVLGGFTTFSSFSLDAVTLMEDGLWAKALLYIAFSLILCLSATVLGAALAQRMA